MSWGLPSVSRRFALFRVISRALVAQTWPKIDAGAVREAERGAQAEGSVEIFHGLSNVDDEAVLRVRVAVNQKEARK